MYISYVKKTPRQQAIRHLIWQCRADGHDVHTASKGPADYSLVDEWFADERSDAESDCAVADDRGIRYIIYIKYLCDKCDITFVACDGCYKCDITCDACDKSDINKRNKYCTHIRLINLKLRVLHLAGTKNSSWTDRRRKSGRFEIKRFQVLSTLIRIKHAISSNWYALNALISIKQHSLGDKH